MQNDTEADYAGRSPIHSRFRQHAKAVL